MEKSSAQTTVLSGLFSCRSTSHRWYFRVVAVSKLHNNNLNNRRTKQLIQRKIILHRPQAHKETDKQQVKHPKCPALTKAHLRVHLDPKETAMEALQPSVENTNRVIQVSTQVALTTRALTSIISNKAGVRTRCHTTTVLLSCMAI